MTKRTVEALKPGDKPWIAWDDKLVGFGCRVQPSGTKSFIVNYRAGEGGRKAPNKRVVVGRYDRISPDQARRRAQELLGRVAGGGDPAGERAEARALPTLGEVCDDYIESGRDRADVTQRSYRRYANLYLGDWRSRPIDAITRRDIENRFHLLTERHGAVPANQTLSFLRSVYRRPCVDHDGLRNPVEMWLAGGGRYHPHRRRKISSPAEVLPKWREGIEAVVRNPVHRDLIMFGLYTGMRRGEIISLRWERVDLEAGLFRVEEAKTGVPLELPITRPLGVILARRRANSDAMPADMRGWVFPSLSSKSGHAACAMQRRKEAVRRELRPRLRRQFADPHVRRIIARLERPGPSSRHRSVRALIADGAELQNRLLAAREHRASDPARADALRRAVRPFLQLVEPRARDAETEFALRDIWRYFRYAWSIPQTPIPGRSLVYLVRDAAHERHAVIGIAALGNCPVQMVPRDCAIGWSASGLTAALFDAADPIGSGAPPIALQSIYRWLLPQFAPGEPPTPDARSAALERVLDWLVRGIADAIGDIEHQGLVTEDDLARLRQLSVNFVDFHFFPRPK